MTFMEFTVRSEQRCILVKQHDRGCIIDWKVYMEVRDIGVSEFRKDTEVE